MPAYGDGVGALLLGTSLPGLQEPRVRAQRCGPEASASGMVSETSEGALPGGWGWVLPREGTGAPAASLGAMETQALGQAGRQDTCEGLQSRGWNLISEAEQCQGDTVQPAGHSPACGHPALYKKGTP